MANFTLYHYWRSSCSWRVRWSLFYKKIPFHSVAVNILKSEHQDEAYLKKNPSGYLPCLEMDGKFYGESLGILEYLEELYPSPALLPKNPQDKMRVRQMAYTIAVNTQPLQNLTPQRYYSSDPEKQHAYAVHWTTKGLEAFEKLLDGNSKNGFCFGSELSFADLCLIPQCYNALRFSIDLKKFPQIEKIYENCLTAPTCYQAHPDRYKPAD